MKRSLHTKKKIIAALLIVAGMAVVAMGVYLWRHNSGGQNTATVTTQRFSGPTSQEKAAADAHKDELVKQMDQEKQDQATSGQNQSSQKNVTPVITTATQNGTEIRISGYISGILEEGGTCTATLVQGTQKIVKTAKAFANVSTTQCSPILIDRTEFAAAGDWQVTLAYNSAAAKGASQVQTLAVQ